MLTSFDMNDTEQLGLLPREVVLPASGPKAVSSLTALSASLCACRRCALHAHATQVVGGEGEAGAPIMLVGEQPGNDEDLAGRPFVGPAGQVLRRALVDADIPMHALYMTNVVKHFKWAPRGKRRLHQKPNLAEVRACKPWLDEEVALVRPRLVVCLGATAAQALWGATFRVTASRGTVLESVYGPAFATIHPSAILRMPDAQAQVQAQAQFTADLQRAYAWVCAQVELGQKTESRCRRAPSPQKACPR